MSIGTPGIEADVIVVSSFEELEELDPLDVRGKIVLYNAPFTTYGDTVQYRTKGLLLQQKKETVGVLVRSVGPSSLQSPHTGATSYSEGLGLQLCSDDRNRRANAPLVQARTKHQGGSSECKR